MVHDHKILAINVLTVTVALDVIVTEYALCFLVYPLIMHLSFVLLSRET